MGCIRWWLTLAVNLTGLKVPRLLVKQNSGCDCEGVLSVDWLVGEWTVWGRATLNVAAASNWMGAQTEWKVEVGELLSIVLPSQAGVFLLPLNWNCLSFLQIFQLFGWSRQSLVEFLGSIILWINVTNLFIMIYTLLAIVFWRNVKIPTLINSWKVANILNQRYI